MNSIDKLPRMETARLVLTTPKPDDAQRMLRYVDRNRTHFAPWEQMRSDQYYTLEFWSKHLASSIEESQQEKSLQFVLLDRNDESGPIQGQCTFSNIVRGPFQAAYLGYSLDYQAVGKGMMYEGLTATIKDVFEEMNLHRIMANYMPANERSGKLLKRLGFTVEGYARDYLFLAGS